MLSEQDVAMSDFLDEHLEVLRAEGKAERTIEDRRQRITKLDRDLRYGVMAATREQLKVWLAGPQTPGKRWSRWTKFTYAGHVNGFLEWLVIEGYRDTNPMAGMRRPKAPSHVPLPATDQQLALALSAGEPVHTAVLLAAYEGMRRFEISAAHREHVTEDLVFIPHGKGGDEQAVPTHPIVWQHLRDRDPGPLIGLDVHQLGHLVRETFRELGFPKWFGLHAFRKWFGTTVQREQGDLRVTQECMRHKSVRSTQIYTFVSPRQTRDAVALLPVVSPRQPLTGADPQRQDGTA